MNSTSFYDHIFFRILICFFLGLISFGRKFYRLNGRILRFLTSEELSYEHTFVLKGGLVIFYSRFEENGISMMGFFFNQSIFGFF